jgi:hypothetical protein
VLLGLACAAYFLLSCLTFRLGIFDSFDSIEYLSPFRPAGFDPRRLPLYPLLVYGFGRVIGDSSVAGMLIGKLCVAGTGALLFGLVARLFGAFAAASGVLVLGVLPLTVMLSSIVHPFPLYGLLLAWCAERLVRSVEGDDGRALGRAAVAAGLAAFTRPEGFALVGLVGIWQAAAYARKHPVHWPSWIGGDLVMLAAVLWFLLHPGYALQAVGVSEKLGLAQVLDYLATYLRAYPFLFGWLALPFVFVGLASAWSRAEGATAAARRAYAGIALYVAVSHLALLMTPSGWLSMYLYPTTVLAAGLAGAGLAWLRAVRGGAVLAPAALAGCTGLALRETLPALSEFPRMFGPYHTACMFAAEHAPPDQFLVAADARHAQHWTGLSTVGYARNIVRRGSVVVLEDVLLRKQGTDLESEIAWLTETREAEILFDERGEFRPLFATSRCTLDPALSWTPRILDLRKTPQPSRAVVLRIPGERRKKR